MDSNQVRELFQKRRRALGLSQVELAELTEVSLPTIQNIEGGKGTNPSLDVLNKL
ncbi:MAG: helix-turn-helix transcriptional regulator, partial [Bdellovibrionales bacterium]|nr:helix-turn-helix transcriptional regulator [Bdellovibrionales bacterium]